MAGAGPLSGVRIIEVATFVAAPFCGLTLAQLGAEVIRIDAIGGGPDFDRWPVAPSGASLYWTGLNRGKRSVTLDLRSDGARSLIRDLLGPEGDGSTGVLVTNAYLRPWLEYGELSDARRDLVQVHLRGKADRGAAVDYTVNAESGLPSVTGPDPRSAPVNHVLPAWDLLAGVHAALAVVTALRRRDRTGEGGLVEVSLEDIAFGATSALGLLPEPTVLGREREPSGNHLYGSFGVDFATADGRRVMVVTLTTRQWQDLVDVTGTRAVLEAIEDQLRIDFREDGVRYEYRQLIEALLAPWFRQRDTAAVVDALADTSVLVGEYRSFAEATEHGLAQGVLVPVEQAGIGSVALARSPLRFGSATTVDDAAAPILGEHTDQVLAEVLGLPPERIAGLRTEAVIP